MKTYLKLFDENGNYYSYRINGKPERIIVKDLSRYQVYGLVRIYGIWPGKVTLTTCNGGVKQVEKKGANQFESLNSGKIGKFLEDGCTYVSEPLFSYDDYDKREWGKLSRIVIESRDENGCKKIADIHFSNDLIVDLDKWELKLMDGYDTLGNTILYRSMKEGYLYCDERNAAKEIGEVVDKWKKFIDGKFKKV